jgi:hypothetical protein
MDKDYWDESSRSFVKKWQLNRRTASLSFTNKWVCGMLRRYSKKLRLQELHACAECLAALSVIRVDPDDDDSAAAVAAAALLYGASISSSSISSSSSTSSSSNSTSSMMTMMY